MTFNISSNGVNNTNGTIAKFGSNPNGNVKIHGNFQNTGNVQIDVRANLEVVGNIINAGNFSIRDYVREQNYDLIEKAIAELNGEAKNYLSQSYKNIKTGNAAEANNYFKRFINYIKDHPELVTSSIQIILQIFSK
ncbi:MAG: hypothetical protein V1732_02175 [Patescibacteria group bacterium]|nr:hypothetical protein [Patescibacteria group bacterium]MBU4141878.1 hypothetical protein [Patescibacteria group bacterium]